MRSPTAIGIDLGTSAVKAVLLGADGMLLGEAGAPLTVQRPQPGWSEQHPADWLVAADAAMRALRKRVPIADWAAVSALAVAGQMHGAVLLDEDAGVLRPAILWNDGRSQPHCEELERREPRTRAITANRAMAGFTAPKLLWVAEHEPELFSRVAKVLLPKDWLIWQLAGVMSSDCSDAAGTLWLDVAARRWSEAMLAATGLTSRHMPTLHEGPEPVGQLLPRWCEAWGLARGVVVAAGAGDNAAGAVGIAAVRPGQGFVSLGTSGVLFIATADAASNPGRGVHTFCHTLPGTWHQMAVMLSSASALSWLAEISRQGPSDLLANVTADIRPDAPLFLPYLSGERTPHADPQVRASFLGISASSTRDDLTYAVMEGVAFSFADGLAALRESGTEPTQLQAIGGGARSDAWLQLLADALGLPLDRPGGAEVGPALGAARLAQLAHGLPTGEVLRAPAVARRFEPRAAQRETLLRRWERFRLAYAPCRAHGTPS